MQLKEITKKENKIFVQFLDNKIKSSNTFNLLNYIKKKNKNAKLFFLIGADNLAKFHKWDNWKKIPEFAKIAIFQDRIILLNLLRPLPLKSLIKKT